ncbi:hypothetical protein PCASD_26152, partial [Puccinia coronata f. sp. avenae]
MELLSRDLEQTLAARKVWLSSSGAATEAANDGRGWTNPAFGCYLRQLCLPEIHPRHQSTVHKLDKCDTSVTLWDICLQPAKSQADPPPD